MPETKLCLIQHGQWVTKHVFQYLLHANLKYLFRCHLKKILYICFKKLVFCELCNSQPFVKDVIYMVRTTIKLCTSFKKIVKDLGWNSENQKGKCADITRQSSLSGSLHQCTHLQHILRYYRSIEPYQCFWLMDRHQIAFMKS